MNAWLFYNPELNELIIYHGVIEEHIYEIYSSKTSKITTYYFVGEL